MILIFIFIIGTILGSFCNVLILRTIRNESVIYPGSHCDVCHTPLKYNDMIPIISYLNLKGRCRYCKSKIPLETLMVEIISGILMIYIFNPEEPIKTLILFLSVLLAMVIAVIDLKTFDIYMYQILGLIALGLVYRFNYIGYDLDFLKIIFIFSLGYLLILKISKGGLGDGDIYYYLSLMLFLKNKDILWFMLGSIWICAIYSIFVAIKRKSMKIEIPFCIFIFLSFLIFVLK